MMNGPRSISHKQVNSEAENAFPKRQPNLSLPCIPSDVDHWFAAELEKRGINQLIYGPTTICLLVQQRQSSGSMAVADLYTARVRAVELLMEACGGSRSTDDISNLVDEVDHRLRQCELSQEYPRPGRDPALCPLVSGAGHPFSSNPNLAVAVTAAAALGGSADEGFLDWSSSPKAVAGPVTAAAAATSADRGEEEGELLLNEVSNMLQKFNMEVRHGVSLKEAQTAAEAGGAAAPAKEAAAAPVVGIPAALHGRKRDASIDSGCSSFNWSSSRDGSNESSPPSALDWLSVSPGGSSSIWSTSPAPNTPFSCGHPAEGNPMGGPLSADVPWSYQHSGHPQIRARMRLTSAPSLCYLDEEMPELSRHRVLSTSHTSPGAGGSGASASGSGGGGGGGGGGSKKKHKNSGGKVGGGKHHLHHGHHGHHHGHHHGQQQQQAHARQASPPSDSGSAASSGSTTSSGGCSPPAGGAGAGLAAPSSPSTGAAGKSSLEKSRRACSFYLRGHCKKEDCEFAHDLTKVTCKFWMTGECFKGDTCPFLHGQLNA